HLTEVLAKAAALKGTAFVEIYQNCNIFNDGAFELLKEPDTRADNQIRLEHGKPIRFGKDGERGVRLTDDCRGGGGGGGGGGWRGGAASGGARPPPPGRPRGRAEPGLHALPAVARRRRTDPDRGVPRRGAAGGRRADVGAGGGRPGPHR